MLKMRRYFSVGFGSLVSAAFSAAVLSSGCMPLVQQGYPVGGIYSSTSAPSALDRVEVSGANRLGSKTGSACSTGILGLVAWGDASIDAAKKAGAITSVDSVEYQSTAVLGAAYVSVCTVVHGS